MNQVSVIDSSNESSGTTAIGHAECVMRGCGRVGLWRGCKPRPGAMVPGAARPTVARGVSPC
jgi:hypothetical protein